MFAIYHGDRYSYKLMTYYLTLGFQFKLNLIYNDKKAFDFDFLDTEDYNCENTGPIRSMIFV